MKILDDTSNIPGSRRGKVVQLIDQSDVLTDRVAECGLSALVVYAAHVEDTDSEVDHGLEPILFPGQSSGHHRHAPRVGAEEADEKNRGRHGRAVTPYELAEPVARVALAGGDREAFEVSAEVGGQLLHGPVPLRRLAAHRFQHDGIEVATQDARGCTGARWRS